MESIIVIVGFLGAGKTTLLKQLTERYLEAGWQPYVILNDYENAYLDVQQLLDTIPPDWVKALNGSCICCSGIDELRESVNRVPEREKGITLIEANGTTDACSLMGFLGVGLKERFAPPVQISVVDVKNWQRRETVTTDIFGRGQSTNELEANQIQVSSLIVLNHLESVSEQRRSFVEGEVKRLNPSARVIPKEELDISALPALRPSENAATPLDHQKAHWSSCSIDLPSVNSLSAIRAICDSLPKSILRIKGCTRVGESEQYTYFERCPDGEVSVRPYRGVPVTGPKLLAVGPGSDPAILKEVVAGGRG